MCSTCPTKKQEVQCLTKRIVFSHYCTDYRGKTLARNSRPVAWWICNIINYELHQSPSCYWWPKQWFLVSLDQGKLLQLCEGTIGAADRQQDEWGKDNKSTCACSSWAFSSTLLGLLSAEESCAFSGRCSTSHGQVLRGLSDCGRYGDAMIPVLSPRPR